MTDMESLDRAVEEARKNLDAWVTDVHPRPHGSYGYDLTAFEAAVSAKTRAEERQLLDGFLGRAVDAAFPLYDVRRIVRRDERGLPVAWELTDDEVTAIYRLASDIKGFWEPARSSEEAEVCLHPRVSRMAAVGGPIICGVCGEEAGG